MGTIGSWNWNVSCNRESDCLDYNAKFSFVLNRNFSGGEEVVVTITTQGCQGQENEINYLEHVQVFVNISHNHRGNLAIYLKSPQGKFVIKCFFDNLDFEEKGHINPFMWVHWPPCFRLPASCTQGFISPACCVQSAFSFTSECNTCWPPGSQQSGLIPFRTYILSMRRKTGIKIWYSLCVISH